MLCGEGEEIIGALRGTTRLGVGTVVYVTICIVKYFKGGSNCNNLIETMRTRMMNDDG